MTTMKELLEANPQYREKLYIRGFILTDKEAETDVYPFYGKWNSFDFADRSLLVHPLQRAYVCGTENVTVALVGHAYDPFTMQSDENEIIAELAGMVADNEVDFFERLNELTGNFAIMWFDGKLHIVGDASGMMTVFYAEQDGRAYVSSHTMLLGEMLGCKKSEYAKRLIGYRFFSLLGNSMPGDITQFSEVKRLVPNHVCTFSDGAFENRRFYWPSVQADMEYEDILRNAADILNRSMKLIPEKWEKPAISLTGGCDSKTTLACANGVYDRYAYYSYTSSESEQVDANAAHEICGALGLEHKIYEIPETLGEEDNFEVVAKILRWNCGDIRNSNRNDVRKRIVLNKIDDFDVEVKSWASEIGRAYYSKRFNGRTKFPEKPNGRACTTLYKFFLHDRKLVADTDKVFEEYLKAFYEPAEENPLEWQEQFFWEFRVPSWNGLVITGEHVYSSDITIPYNNRKLLSLLLSVPTEARIKDTLYADIRKYMNPKIDETGIAVTNLKHTDKRAKLEDVYWVLHSKFPL